MFPGRPLSLRGKRKGPYHADYILNLRRRVGMKKAQVADSSALKGKFLTSWLRVHF